MMLIFELIIIINKNERSLCAWLSKERKRFNNIDGEEMMNFC